MERMPSKGKRLPEYPEDISKQLPSRDRMLNVPVPLDQHAVETKETSEAPEIERASIEHRISSAAPHEHIEAPAAVPVRETPHVEHSGHASEHLTAKTASHMAGRGVGATFSAVAGAGMVIAGGFVSGLAIGATYVVAKSLKYMNKTFDAIWHKIMGKKKGHGDDHGHGAHGHAGGGGHH